jgi:hypothetical protein
MSEELALACSLELSALEQRLAAISEVGGDSLLGRSVERDRQLLRFRGDERTRERLREIVAAEAKCCAFLDLALTEADGEIHLSIAAPAEARPVAEGLAAAFDGGRG